MSAWSLDQWTQRHVRHLLVRSAGGLTWRHDVHRSNWMKPSATVTLCKRIHRGRTTKKKLVGQSAVGTRSITLFDSCIWCSAGWIDAMRRDVIWGLVSYSIVDCYPVYDRMRSNAMSTEPVSAVCFDSVVRFRFVIGSSNVCIGTHRSAWWHWR